MAPKMAKHVEQDVVEKDGVDGHEEENNNMIMSGDETAKKEEKGECASTKLRGERSRPSPARSSTLSQ